MEKMHKNSKTQRVAEVVSAKPVLGLPLGNCKLTFRYLDQSAIEFEGFISDVTGLFTNADIQEDFKRVVLEEISYLKANSFKPIEPENEAKPVIVDVGADQEATEPDTALATTTGNTKDENEAFQNSALQKAILAFKAFDFSEACRVLLLESGSSTLHLILQIGRINPLATYVNNIDHSQWSFGRGLKYDFLVSGAAATLPHRQRLHELGEVFVHIFIPDDHRDQSKLNMKLITALKPLLAIIPFIPGTVDIDQTLKSKNDEIDSKEASLRMLRQSLQEKAVRNDSAAIAVAGVENYNHDEPTHHSRFDFTDALLIGAPTFLASLLGWWSFDPTSMGWIGGLGIGFILGCFLVSRRK
jgi:hypothetical protein